MESLFKNLGMGDLLAIALPFLGWFASFVTMRGDVKEALKSASEAKSKAEVAQRDLDGFKLTAAKEYVSMTSMREFKDDISKEIKEIEHVIRGLLMGKGRGSAA